MSVKMQARHLAGTALYRGLSRAQQLRWQWRRQWFALRARAEARQKAARLQVEFAPDVQLGKRISLEIQPGTQNELCVGRGSVVGDDVALHFLGGSMIVGERVVIRRGCQADTSGQLRIGDECIVSYGTYLHCASSLTIEEMVGIGEYTTITDSVHVRTPIDVYFAHHVTTSPTRIGRNCWLGAHAVVAAGVHVGDGCVIGANSTVTEDVPAGWLAVGSPAKAIKQLEVIDVELPGEAAPS